jgi:hypothetical protein
VQADYLDAITDDTLLVRVTSKIHGITGTEVILLRNSWAGRSALGNGIPSSRGA